MEESKALTIPSERGELYLKKYDDQLLKSLDVLLSLLSSYFKATSDGPAYVRSLKQISKELASIKLKLNAIKDDRAFGQTRTEFLQQNVTDLVFPDEYPEFGASDIEYKSFLLKVIELYLRGATKDAIRDGVQYVTGGNVVIEERNSTKTPGKSFRFDINVYLASSQFAYKALTERAVRILVDILKPAHTIYRISYILVDAYDPLKNKQTGSPDQSITNDPSPGGTAGGTLTISYKWKAYNKYLTSVLNNPNSFVLNGFVKRVNGSYAQTFDYQQFYHMDGSVKPDDSWNISDDDLVTFGNSDSYQNPSIYDNNPVCVIEDKGISTELEKYPPFVSRPIDLTFSSDVYAAFRFNLDEPSNLHTTIDTYTGVGFGISDGVNAVIVGAIATDAVNDSTAIWLANELKHAFNQHIISIDYHVKTDRADLIVYDDARTVAQAKKLCELLVDGFESHIKSGPTDGYHLVSDDSTQIEGTSPRHKLNKLRSEWNSHIVKTGMHFVRDDVNGVSRPKQIGLLKDYSKQNEADGWDCTNQDWTEPSSYRLVLTSDKRAELYVDGELEPRSTLQSSELLKSTDVNLPLNQLSQVFFGSLSYERENKSYWAFGRVGVYPIDKILSQSDIQYVHHFNAMPEAQNKQWIKLGYDSYAKTDISTNTLTINAMTSAYQANEEEFGIVGGPFLGYMHVEPTLNPKSTIILDTTVQVKEHDLKIDNESCGIFLSDGTFSTSIVFLDPDNQAISLKYDSAGMPDNALWQVQPGVNSFIYYTNRNLEQPIYSRRLVLENNTTTSPNLNDDRANVVAIENADTNAIFSNKNWKAEIELKIDKSTGFKDLSSASESYRIHAGVIEVKENGSSGNPGKTIRVRFLKPSSSGSPSFIGISKMDTNMETLVAVGPFDWSSAGIMHLSLQRDRTHFKVFNNNVEIVSCSISSLSNSYFGPGETLKDSSVLWGLNKNGDEATGRTIFGQVTFYNEGAESTGKKIGVYIGGDAKSISSYKTAELEWRTAAQPLRIIRDPMNGVRIYKTDATSSADPAKPILEVEYDLASLPIAKNQLLDGLIPSKRFVAFGSFNGETFTRSLWKNKIDYTITATPKRIVQSFKMVLNYASTLASGEHYSSISPHRHLNTRLDSRGTPEDDFIDSLATSSINLSDSQTPAILSQAQQYRFMDTGEYVSKSLDKTSNALAYNAGQNKFGDSYIAIDGKLVKLSDNPDWKYNQMKIWRTIAGVTEIYDLYIGAWTATLNSGAPINGVG